MVLQLTPLGIFLGVSMSFIVGFFRTGLFSFICVGLYFLFWELTKRKRKLTRTLVLNARSQSSQIYPRRPTVEWVNFIIAHVWTNYKPKLEAFAIATITPQITSRLPSIIKDFTIKELNIGDSPPSLDAIRIDENADNNLEIETKIIFVSTLETRIACQAGPLPVSVLVKNLLLVAKVRIELKLIQVFPFVEEMWISLLTQPTYDVVLRPYSKIDIVEIPGLANSAKDFFSQHILGDLLIWPNKIHVDLLSIIVGKPAGSLQTESYERIDDKKKKQKHQQSMPDILIESVNPTDYSLNLLNPKDWNSLLTSSHTKTQRFSAGDRILCEGEKSQNKLVFRIKSGTVRMDKEFPSEENPDQIEMVTVKKFTVGEVFGETCFLPGFAHVLSAIADDNVEAYVIAGEAVDAQISVDPAFGRRFYEMLASRLCTLLNQLSVKTRSQPRSIKSSNPNLSVSDPGISSFSEIERKKIELAEQTARCNRRFELPSNSTIIAQFPAGMTEQVGISLNGNLFLADDYLCFLAKFFSSSHKAKFAYSYIESLEPAKKSDIVLFYSGKKFTFKLNKARDEAFEKISHLVKTKKGKENKIASPATTSVDNPKKLTTTLTPEDLQLILKGSQNLNFEQDNPIIKSGARANALYQISSGQVRIEEFNKTTQKIEKVATLKTGEIFGELEFLQGGEFFHASVIADTEEVSIYMIDLSALKNSFVEKPDFGARFFQFLAVLVIKRYKAYFDNKLKETTPGLSSSIASNTS